MSMKNPVTPLEIDPGTVRLVAQHLNHYATPGSKNHTVPVVKEKVKFSLEQATKAQVGSRSITLI
jgi:hypothetical protein